MNIIKTDLPGMVLPTSARDVRKKGKGQMKRSILTCAIKKSNGVVTQIGRGYILQPETHFRGGEVKWYQDKPKKGATVDKD